MKARLRALVTRLFGRDPVVTVAVLAAGIIAALPLVGWTPPVTGAVTAVVTTAAGVASAALLSVDRALPLLVGLGKSIIALLLTFGVHFPENYVTAIMAFLTFVAGLATRPQVGAVEPPRDRNGRPVDWRGWPVGELDVTAEMTDREFVEFHDRLHDAAARGVPLPTTGLAGYPPEDVGPPRTEDPRADRAWHEDTDFPGNPPLPDITATAYTNAHAQQLQALDDDGEHQHRGAQRRGKHWTRGPRDQPGGAYGGPLGDLG